MPNPSAANGSGPLAQAKAAAIFDLGNPHIDWVEAVAGMGIEAAPVTDAMSLAAAVKTAFADRGPRLIEAVM